MQVKHQHLDKATTCLVPRRESHLLRKATALALLWWAFLMLVNRTWRMLQQGKSAEGANHCWTKLTKLALSAWHLGWCLWQILWKHKWTWPCPYLWACKMISAGNFLAFPFMCQIKTETNQIKQRALKAWLAAVQTVNLSHGRKKIIKQSVFFAALQLLHHMMWH